MDFGRSAFLVDADPAHREKAAMFSTISGGKKRLMRCPHYLDSHQHWIGFGRPRRMHLTKWSRYEAESSFKMPWRMEMNSQRPNSPVVFGKWQSPLETAEASLPIPYA